MSTKILQLFCKYSVEVRMSDYYPSGPRFYSWLYPRNFSGSIGSGIVTTQPCEDKRLLHGLFFKVATMLYQCCEMELGNIIYTRGRLDAPPPTFIPVCSNNNNNNAVLNKCSWNTAAMILKEDQKSCLKIECARGHNARQCYKGYKRIFVKLHYITIQ